MASRKKIPTEAIFDANFYRNIYLSVSLTAVQSCSIVNKLSNKEKKSRFCFIFENRTCSDPRFGNRLHVLLSYFDYMSDSVK